MPKIMKLKERLVAASLGFMAALCLLAIYPLILSPPPQTKVRILCFKFSINPLGISLTRETDTKKLSNLQNFNS
jgi:hypothetical protein